MQSDDRGGVNSDQNMDPNMKNKENQSGKGRKASHGENTGEGGQNNK